MQDLRLRPVGGAGRVGAFLLFLYANRLANLAPQSWFALP